MIDIIIRDADVYKPTRRRAHIPFSFERRRRYYAQPSLTIHVGTLTASHTWTKVDLYAYAPAASPRGPCQGRTVTRSGYKRVSRSGSGVRAAAGARKLPGSVTVRLWPWDWSNFGPRVPCFASGVVCSVCVRTRALASGQGVERCGERCREVSRCQVSRCREVSRGVEGVPTLCRCRGVSRCRTGVEVSRCRGCRGCREVSRGPRAAP